MEYNVGDTVFISKNLNLKRYCNSQMVKYAGKKAKITDKFLVNEFWFYRIDIAPYSWCEEMFDDVQCLNSVDMLF